MLGEVRVGERRVYIQYAQNKVPVVVHLNV